MSPKLPIVTGREVVRAALKVGFVFDRQKGSHAVYYRERDRARIVVPMLVGKTIKRKTLAGILEDMGLNAEEFRDLL